MLNRDAVAAELSEAITALDELKVQIESGEFDESETMDLGYQFEHVVFHLCRAWYFKWMRTEDIEALSESDWHYVGHSIPNWGLSLQLVALDTLDRFDKRELMRAPPDADGQ